MAGSSRTVVQNITSIERNKNSGAQTYHEFKPKSILRSQSKQTQPCGNSMLMSNNPPQLHNASQDQNVDFFAGNPFQLQNRFQMIHARSTYGYKNGFQTQNNPNSRNGIHSFRVNDDINPSTENLNIYSGASRFPDYKNIKR